jgi:hypothetical protein
MVGIGAEAVEVAEVETADDEAGALEALLLTAAETAWIEEDCAAAADEEGTTEDELA